MVGWLVGRLVSSLVGWFVGWWVSWSVCQVITVSWLVSQSHYPYRSAVTEVCNNSISYVHLSVLTLKENVLYVSIEIVMANKYIKRSHVNISTMSDDVTISVTALKTISQICSVFIIIFLSFKNSATGNLKRFAVTYYKLQKSMNVKMTTEKDVHVGQSCLAGPNVNIIVCIAYPVCCP
jgi:hypothetical protein